MVENRPYLTFISHLIVLIGIAITIMPIWITFVASTHPIENIMDGTVPMWPGGQLFENYATVLGSGIEDAGGVVQPLAFDADKFEVYAATPNP